MSETEIILEILNNDNKIDTIFIEKLIKATNILKKKKILNMTIKKLSIDDFKKYRKIYSINNLFSFECSNIKLDRIPIMMNVEILKAPNCKLYSMAHFYNNLKELNCAFNYLYFLPEIPKCEILNCQNNKIIKLPENLDNVKYLNCSNNNISFLPFLPNCQKLILDGNPIIYYTDEVKKKFNLQVSPMTNMVYDYINIKNNLTSIVDISVRKEDRIEYLFEDQFRSERDFVEHIKKLLYNFEKFDIDEKFENFLNQVIDIYNFKNKYIKYKLKYHKLKTKIGGNVKS